MSDPATAEKPGPHAGTPPFPAPRWEIFSWCMFDFANSSFTTVIVSVVFSVYYVKRVCGGGEDGTFYWNLAQALSQTVVLLTAPLLGAIADFSGAKKRFLCITWLACCAFTASLWCVTPGAIIPGLVLFLFANIAFSVGENLTASFLPELARTQDLGKVSGFGWAWGYVGGLACLGLCWSRLSRGFGPENVDGLREISLIVAGFFLIAAIPTMLFLRERAVRQPLPPGESYLTIGYRQVGHTLRNLRNFRVLAFFLVVFFVYNCGIVIVVGNAGIFAAQVLDFSGKEIGLLFILLQITSAIGAFVFGYVQDKWGARKTIVLALLLWAGVVAGCAGVHSKAAFWVLGNLAGLAIGSSQSAARALVGVFSPPRSSAEFFGFWGLCGKASAVVGLYSFGSLVKVTGSMRFAIGATTSFFVLGIIGMLFVDEKAGRQAAIDAEKALASGNA